MTADELHVPPVGRNAPCPCGGGKKYKKCHGRREDRRPPIVIDPSRTRPDEPCPCPDGTRTGKRFKDCHLPGILKGLEINARIEAEDRERVMKFGEVRPMIHANWGGRKWVAVGNQMMVFKEDGMKTPTDFLIAYALSVLTPDWGNAELKKPLNERHPILQWYDGLCDQAKKFPKNDAGLITIVPDGPTMAFLLLAHDLYTLRHHGSLQESVVKRLKHRDQFQGARYELFATAVCIRAGFDIRHEREKNRTEPHPEFIATHRVTGQVIALEAKSKHRPQVLGFQPGGKSEPVPKVAIRGLLLGAFEKKAGVPLVAFVDVNFPPDAPGTAEPSWLPEVIETMKGEVEGREPPDPFNLVIFSNHPYHYAEAGSPLPLRDVWHVAALQPRFMVEHPHALQRIAEEAAKWGLIPTEFPADPRTNNST